MTIPGFEPVELAGEWPPGLPSGVLETSLMADGSVEIGHADPVVVFSAEIVDGAAFGLSPEMTLEMTGSSVARGHVGALLKIRAANRQVVYRLTEWVPSIRAYVGEWPE